MVAKLEADLESVEGNNQRDECNKLREEIERLKGEMEHRALKGDFNSNARVLHFTMNPAAIAEQQAEEKQKALLRELEELRAKVAAGGTGTTASPLQIQGNYSSYKYLPLNVYVSFNFILNIVLFRNCRIEANQRHKDRPSQRGL